MKAKKEVMQLKKEIKEEKKLKEEIQTLQSEKSKMIQVYQQKVEEIKSSKLDNTFDDKKKLPPPDQIFQVKKKKGSKVPMTSLPVDEVQEAISQKD